MDIIFQSIISLLFFLGFLFIYIVTIAILRPFRKHRRRKKSTIALKLSYLLFLLLFMSFTYLLLFGEKALSPGERAYETLFHKHFLLYLTALILPTLAIFFRKKIRHYRIIYNVLFSFLNSVYVSYMLFLLLTRQWVLF
jgi:hypothetical protein